MSVFQRRHYEKIGQILAKLELGDMWGEMVWQMSEELGKDNPRFKCGVFNEYVAAQREPHEEMKRIIQGEPNESSPTTSEGSTSTGETVSKPTDVGGTA